MSEKDYPSGPDNLRPGWVDERTLDFKTGGGFHSRRLDQYLAGRFSYFSRQFFQKLIKEGNVLVNGKPAKASMKIFPGDHIHAELPDPEPYGVQPEYVPLDILYEDEDIIVINKQPGMVVHPARGHRFQTLVSGVLFHSQSLSEVDDPLRPGIVHRLDKDTSGVILFAKTTRVHSKIAIQWERRTVDKIYHAIVFGEPEHDAGRIDIAIRKHPKHREKQQVTTEGGKHAVTDFRVLERFDGFAYVECVLHTGRTHQIRVHLQHLGHPIVGDQTYGHPTPTEPMLRGETRILGGDPVISRQALHAFRLSVTHPVSGARLEFEAPLPLDMRRLLEMLRAYRRG